MITDVIESHLHNGVASGNYFACVTFSHKILGWPQSPFGFFHKMLQGGKK